MSSALLNNPDLAAITSETVAEPLKFLIDTGLQRLTYWLRTAGYDTCTIEQAPDKNNNIDAYYLIQQAKQENRLIITTNNMYSDVRGADKYLLVLSNHKLKQQIVEINKAIQIDWLSSPLSRCINCNNTITSTTQNSESDSSFCPHCQQLACNKSEIEKITQQLIAWNQS